MPLTSNPLDWYIARAGGVVAYVLLSTVVAIGLSMTGKKSMKRWPRFALEDVHRFGGILVGTFVVIHIVSVAIDSYLPFSLVSLFVPLVAKYRPIWISLGIVAAELLLALAFTNHYRNGRISYGFWRKAHYVNFVVWTAATLHGLGSGTDRSTPWLLAIYAIAVGTVCALIVWRVLRRTSPVTGPLRLAPVGAAGVAVVLVIVLAVGPLRFQPKPWNAAHIPRPPERQDPDRQRRHQGHHLDVRERHGIAARTRSRRSARHAPVGDVNRLPDGVPAERHDLPRNGDQRAQHRASRQRAICRAGRRASSTPSGAGTACRPCRETSSRTPDRHGDATGRRRCGPDCGSPAAGTGRGRAGSTPPGSHGALSLFARR